MYLDMYFSDNNLLFLINSLKINEIALDRDAVEHARDAARSAVEPICLPDLRYVATPVT